MSQTVDDRVVSMEFDNSNFEKNVATSTDTIEKLKSSLNFDGVGDSFGQITSAANAVNLSSIESGVQSLEDRFSTLGVVGMQVIENLTDKAMTFASKVGSFFTEGLVSGGWERAMNLEEANFQLEGLLKDEEAVAAVMENVNDAVDGTAYSLDAAALVASQLTASGIEAGDEMYTALRAVAGVAAQTNSEYSDIGQIFTTVAGNGRLMGEQLLQLSSRGFNAAAVLGDYLGETEADVREMVSAGEIDFATFAAAMDDAFGDHAKDANKTFSGAMANINAALNRVGAKFFQDLIADEGVLVTFFNTIRERINDVDGTVDGLAGSFTQFVTDVVSSVTDYISKVDLATPLNIFYDSIYSVANILGALWSILVPIGQALKDVIPDGAANSLSEFVSGVRSFTETLTLTEDQASKIRTIFTGVFSVLGLVASAALDVAKGVADVIGNFDGLGYAVLSVVAGFSELVTSFANAIAKGDVFGKIIESISGFASALASGISQLFTGSSGIDSLMSDFAEKFEDIFSENGMLGTLVQGGLFGVIVYNLKNMIYQLKTLVRGGQGGLLSGISSLFSQVESFFYSLQNNVRVSTIASIAGALVSMAAALFVLSMIDSDKLASSLAAITVLCVELGGLIGLFSVLDKTTATTGFFKGGLERVTGVLIGMSVGILLLATALKKLSSLGWNELAVGLTGVTILLVELMGAMAVMEMMSARSDGGKLMAGAANVLIFAAAMTVLADACAKLGSLSFNELIKGVGGILSLTTIMVASSVVLSKMNTNMMAGSASVLVFAAAMTVLADACAKLGSLSFNELAKGVGGILSLTTIMVASSVVLSKMNTNMMVGSASVLIFAAAMIVLADACSKLGSLSFNELAKGVGGILSLTTIMVAASVVLSKMNTNMMAGSASVLVFAAAMVVLADAMETMSQMSVGDIGKSLAAIGGSLVIMSVGLKSMTGSVGGAAALLVASTALIALGGALKIISSVGIAGIAVSLAGIAGAFLLLSTAARVLAPVIPTLLSFSGALALAGAGMLAFGVGVLALSAGIAALVAAVSTGAATLVVGIKSVITGLLNTIIDSAPLIGDALVAVLSMLGDVILEMAPMLASGFAELFGETVSAIADSMGTIVDALYELIMSALEALAEKAPDFISRGSEILGTIFSAIFESLGSIDFEDLQNLALGVGGMTAVMVAMAGLSRLFPQAAVGVGEFGILLAELSVVLAALGGLSQIPGLKWLVGEGGDLLESIGTSIGQFVGGLIGGVALGASSSLPELADNLSAFMDGLGPFLDGVSKIDASSFEGVSALSDAILKLTGANLLDSITSFVTGGQDLGSFAESLVPFGTAMQKYSAAVSGLDTEAISSSATAAEAIVKVANAIPAEGGVWQVLAGGQDLGLFAESLVPFGTAMQKYSAAVSGLDAEAISSSATAAEAIVKVANAIPAEGGVWQVLAGGQDLGSFAESLVPFGTAMQKYSESVAGLDVSAISASVTAAYRMKALAAAIQDVDFSVFGNFKMDKLGSSLKAYSSDASSVDYGAVSSSISAIKSVKATIESLASIDTSGVASFSSAVSSLGSIDYGGLSSIGSSMGSSLSGGLSGGLSGLSSSLLSSVSSAVGSLSSTYSSFRSAGMEMGSALTAGLSKNRSAFVSAAQLFGTSANSRIRAQRATFVSSGAYLGSGLVIGIQSKYKDAYNAGYKLGQKAAQGEKDGQDSDSPSKLTIQYGKWFGEGLVIGISSMTSAVYNTAEGLGETAVESLSVAMASVSDVVDSDLEMSPVISPILDLSDVSAKSASIAGMLDSSTLEASGMIGAMVDARLQNGSNADVVKAIKKLQGSIDNMPRNTTTIGSVTYDDGSNINTAVAELTRAARMERRR